MRTHHTAKTVKTLNPKKGVGAQVTAAASADEKNLDRHCFRVPYVVHLLREGLQLLDSQVCGGHTSLHVRWLPQELKVTRDHRRWAQLQADWLLSGSLESKTCIRVHKPGI